MSKSLGTQLNNYATGTAKGCQHPIKDVDDNDYCHACNTQLTIKVVDKDATIAAQAARIEALTEALEQIAKMDGPTFGEAFGRCVDTARAALLAAVPVVGAGTRAEVDG